MLKLEKLLPAEECSKKMPFSPDERKPSECVDLLASKASMNPCGSKLVTLKKQKGITLQDCDAYIGPKVSNEHWEKEESKWHCPYYNPENPKEALDKYRKLIENNTYLMSILPTELQGKTLGCFCKDLASCHGTVLIELMNRRLTRNPETIYAPDLLLFKGQKSPLSSLFPCHIEYGGKKFCCSEHVRIYWKAIKLYDTLTCPHSAWGTPNKADQKDCVSLIKQIESCDTPYKVVQCGEKFKDYRIENPHVWTKVEAASSAYNALQLKWTQCPEFREYVHEHRNKIFLESTTSPFWGLGKDLADIRRDFERVGEDPRNLKSTELGLFPGCNIFGWLIKLVYCTHLLGDNIPPQHVLERMFDADFALETGGVDGYTEDHPKARVFKGLGYVLVNLREIMDPAENLFSDKSIPRNLAYSFSLL